jgi:hypothetical protein
VSKITHTLLKLQNIRPNILYWCTRSMYISLCARGFVLTLACACAGLGLYEALFEFFPGYSLVVA